MKRLRRIYIIAIAVCLAWSACSTTQNTAISRSYHALNTRYNIVFNAQQLYVEALDAQFKRFENDTSAVGFLRIFPSERSSQKPFLTVVEKCEKAIKLHSISRKPVKDPDKRRNETYQQWYAQKEFNPYLQKAWLLMGKAQYANGDYLQSVGTYLQVIRRFSANTEATCEAQLGMSKAYVALGMVYEAEDRLNKAWRAVRGLPQLQGEFYAIRAELRLLEGNLSDAEADLRQAIAQVREKKLLPRLRFVLAQTLVAMNKKHQALEWFALASKGNISADWRLHTQLKSIENNEVTSTQQKQKKLHRWVSDVRYKNQLDALYSAQARVFLQVGDTLSAVASYRQAMGLNDMGMQSLARLADLYFQRKAYAEALPLYTLLWQRNSDLPRSKQRAEALKRWAKFQKTIHYHDSIRNLALLPEVERNKVIERAVSEKNSEADRLRRQAPIAVQPTWGNQIQTTDNQKNTGDKKYDRAYFLAQLPLTYEQKKASQKATEEALLGLANLFDEELNDGPNAEKTWLDVLTRYPKTSHREEVWNRLATLNAKLGNTPKAQAYRRLLMGEQGISGNLTHPQLSNKEQDSIYSEAYRAYVQSNKEELRRAYEQVRLSSPDSPLMPKFLMLMALADAQKGNRGGFGTYLRELTRIYPQSEVAPLASAMLQFLAQGRKPIVQRGETHRLAFSTLPTAEAETSPEIEQLFVRGDTLAHAVLLFSVSDSLASNELLFRVAEYNFSHYQISTFTVSFVRLAGRSVLKVDGFRNYQEATRYTSEANFDSLVAMLPISQPNFERLLTDASWSDYRSFAKSTYQVDIPSIELVLPARSDVENRPLPEPVLPIAKERRGEEVILDISAIKAPYLTSEKTEIVSQKSEKQHKQELKAKIKAHKQALKEREKIRKEKLKAHQKELKEKERLRKERQKARSKTR